MSQHDTNTMLYFLLCMHTNYYEESLLYPQHFGQSQKVTDLRVFHVEILDKFSQFYWFFHEENESV